MKSVTELLSARAPSDGVEELFLSDAAIARICHPLKQAAARVKFLRGLGLTVATTPSGRPVVVRSHAEAVLSGQRLSSAALASDTEAKTQPEGPRPDMDAFLRVVNGGRSNGAQKKIKSA